MISLSGAIDHQMVSLALHILPIFLLIGLGAALKRGGVFADGFWANIERLTFYILFPALLINSIGGAELTNLVSMMPMAVSLVVACLGITCVCVFAKLFFRSAENFDGPSFCSVLQGVTRPNTYIGLALAYALYGDEGLTVIAVCVIAVIPLVNVISALSHQRWALADGQDGLPATQVIIGAAKNPVVAACLIGFLMNISAVGLPPVLGPMLEILGKGALPLGLMAVGAGLDFRVISTSPLFYLGTALTKLTILPAITYLVAMELTVDGLHLTLAVLFSALPVSATSYVMSRQLGGNAPMMSAIISFTTLLSLATLPIVAAMLHGS